MATAVSIAIRTEAALASLTESARALSVRFGIPPLVVPDRRNDAELDVRRLEALAVFLVALAPEAAVESDTVNYHLMADADLLRLATERGLIRPSGPSRDTLVAMLRDADAPTVVPNTEKTPEGYLVRAAVSDPYQALNRAEMRAAAAAAGMPDADKASRADALAFLLALPPAPEVGENSV